MATFAVVMRVKRVNALNDAALIVITVSTFLFSVHVILQSYCLVLWRCSLRPVTYFALLLSFNVGCFGLSSVGLIIKNA